MGVSRPRHMDDVQWSEYQMTEEYRYELTHEPDYEPYMNDDPYDGFEDHVEEKKCTCGEWIELWHDVNECDYCGETYNAWGQRLKPEEEWDEY